MHSEIDIRRDLHQLFPSISMHLVLTFLLYTIAPATQAATNIDNSNSTCSVDALEGVYLFFDRSVNDGSVDVRASVKR